MLLRLECLAAQRRQRRAARQARRHHTRRPSTQHAAPKPRTV